MKPSAASGWRMRLSRMAITSSSETSLPASMIARACSPISRAGRHFGPQHVAGGDLHQPVELLEPLGLSAFAGARRSKQDQIHRVRPFTRDLRISPSYWCASRWDWICVTVSIVTETTIIRLVPPK